MLYFRLISGCIVTIIWIAAQLAQANITPSEHGATDNMTTENVYHLLSKNAYESIIGKDIEYFPSGYDKDGFIHLSPNMERLISIANKYYTKSKEDFVVVSILKSNISLPVKLIFEAGVSADSKRTKSTSGKLWPHLYNSGITKAMIDNVIEVSRHDDGTFYIKQY